MHECWQFLICMMIWKILLSVQREEKCVCMVTQPTRLESTSKPLSELELTRQMEIFYEKMSAVRASVEWLFADIVNYFKFLDFKKNLRIGLTQVGKMYIVCNSTKRFNLPLF